jgi:hypothetical protein
MARVGVIQRRDFVKGGAAFLCASSGAVVQDVFAFDTPEKQQAEQIWLDSKLFDFAAYTKERYQSDVEKYGLAETWHAICEHVLKHGEDTLLSIENFGELYEEGLALVDKTKKKKSGQYFTPPDVARVMSKWFDNVPGQNICDVACGTGNLILAYFDLIGEARTKAILDAALLHLYDLDRVAIDICLASILIRYGEEYRSKIHVHCVDFLSNAAVLPPNSKVISNPPYANIETIPLTWPETKVLQDTHELYAAFMEKIMRESAGSVIITPYSFIGGRKFYSLRQEMNEFNGFIVSFDNVPGAIFNGRKHGIFNSNTGNSVRAAITIVDNRPAIKGFCLSPLIRFKAIERARLLECKTLENFIGSTRQIVTPTERMFAKCDKRLEHIFQTWKAKSEKKFGDFIIEKDGAFHLYMPNTCRYYTVASLKPMQRKGQIELHFADEDFFNYAYCMINSSFAYWHWRLYDGGITYPSGLLLEMPVFFNLLTAKDKSFFRRMREEMCAVEKKYIIRKNNVGVQENVRYPREYRDKINTRMLSILGLKDDVHSFDVIHSNMALEVNL